jgi:hypothetical protein
VAPNEARDIERLIVELLLAGCSDYYRHQFHLGPAFSKDVDTALVASRRRPKTLSKPEWRKLVDAPS